LGAFVAVVEEGGVVDLGSMRGDYWWMQRYVKDGSGGLGEME
jgi:hypothetical protein